MTPSHPPPKKTTKTNPQIKGKEIAFKIELYKLGGDSFPRRRCSGKYIVLTFVSIWLHQANL